MKTVFACFTCDEWHTRDSYDLFAIATDIYTAINLCKAMARSEGEEISEDDKTLLESINQTQSYEGHGQFIIEQVQVDRLLWARS